MLELHIRWWGTLLTLLNLLFSSASIAGSNQQFIAEVGSRSGNSEIRATRERVIFSGFVPKYRTTDPRSLGGASFLKNMSTSEYRILHFYYLLDFGGLLPEQSVETDIGLNILPKDKIVSLDSGEEMLVAHEFDVDGAGRKLAKVAIPSGGFALKPGQQLSVGSVSAISSRNGGGAQVIGDEQIANGRFMKMYYKVELIRADLVKQTSVTSYRSPYRDRSYVADPLRVRAPATDFKNTSSNNVIVYGLGLFLSDRPDSPPTGHRVTVHVNGVRRAIFELPPHRPGESSQPIPVIFPLSLTLQAGDTVSVRGAIFARKAIVFDFASYLIAGAGLDPTNEQLDMVKVDLNGDGHADIVDIDSAGSVWVSLTAGDGLESTQLEWARDIRSVGKLVLDNDPRNSDLLLKASNSFGLCLVLRADPIQARFDPEYCGAPPSPCPNRCVWGDFNGDGWIDKMTITLDPNIYSVALGGPAGLGKGTPWAFGYGNVDRMFVSHSYDDPKSGIEAEWTEGAEHKCVIYESTGSSFVQTPCAHK